MDRDIYFIRLLLLYLICDAHANHASKCGCKSVRPCYRNMTDELLDHDEASCVSEAAIGTSTLIIYLKAIQKYCPEVVEIFNDKLTYERRNLYEVVIKNPLEKGKEDERPVFVIDAGQEAGTASVGFALYVIEQLVSCEENIQMISKVRWVVMPSTNPDGQVYSRLDRPQWRKNMRPTDEAAYGVDISRNFEGDWKSCVTVESRFSSIYPGDSPASENETMFVQEVLAKYRKNIKLYLSIRRDGHSISYPQGFDSSPSESRAQLEKLAGQVAAKVNQKSGAIYVFTNQSIYDLNGQSRCGHSVDYAHLAMTVPYSYEMRVFLAPESRLITKFQALPRGYESTLRNGYYSAIKELYNTISKEQ